MSVENASYSSDMSVCSPSIKGNAANFTHQSVYIGLEEYNLLCENTSIKPFVAPEESAYSHIGRRMCGIKMGISPTLVSIAFIMFPTVLKM